MFENKEKNKEYLFIAGLVLVALIIGFFMAEFEVMRRAKHEYLEGEKFLNFYKNPDAKAAYYKDDLDKKKITENEYEFLMDDNSLKNAYVEYKTVVDLFTPPESEWVKKSRERLKEVEPEYNEWVKQLESESNGSSNTVNAKK